MAAHLHLASSEAEASSGSDDGSGPQAQAPIRVVLAEDHALMRRTLRELLEAEPSVAVVAVARDLASALNEVERHQPEVLVLDLSLHDGPCAEMLEALHTRAPDTEIVVLTTDDSPVRLHRALSGGVLGYVLKQLADSELLAAVRAAARGAEYVSPRVGEGLDALYSSLTDDRITPREVEVLRLIALGHTSVEIARMLRLSPRTVETHRAHIHHKLGLATRAQLVRYALGRGLLRA